MFPTYGPAVIFQLPHAATGLPSWDCAEVSCLPRWALDLGSHTGSILHRVSHWRLCSAVAVLKF